MPPSRDLESRLRQLEQDFAALKAELVALKSGMTISMSDFFPLRSRFDLEGLADNSMKLLKRFDPRFRDK